MKMKSSLEILVEKKILIVGVSREREKCGEIKRRWWGRGGGEEGSGKRGTNATRVDDL